MRFYIRLYTSIVILAACLVSTYVLAEKHIQLYQSSDLLLIGKSISYLEDTEGSLEIADVLQADNQKKFVSHDRDVFSRPGTKSAFWFKITMQNHSSEDAWLEVGSNYAWYIDFYAPDSSGNYLEVMETGTMRPDENKVYDVNFFWLPLNDAKDVQSRTYYVKVVSGLTYELPLQIGTTQSLYRNKYFNDSLTAGFVGIILVMLLYNFFIYVSTRHHIYIYYLGYLLFMAFSMPYANGYPFIEKFDFLFFNKEFWNNYFLVWHTPAYFFIGTFCIQYLDLKTRSPWLRRLIQAEIIIISGVFPLLNILGYQFVELVNAVQVSIMTLYLTCLVSSYYYAIKGVKQAYYYALGWTFLVGGAFVFFAVINGFLPFNPISRNALYIGTAIEVCLFSLALANRLNELQKEKESIKSENLRLVEDQKELLEREVLSRTTELETMNEELMHSNEELMLTTKTLESERKKLKEVNETKDRLFAIISHDLRTPINSLKGLLNLMHKHNISREEFLQISVDTKHNVEHVHLMLNNLLNWARFQLQGMVTQPESLCLKQVAYENMALFNDLSQNKNIDVINAIDERTHVHVDHDHLNLIIRNILSNALKFTNPGGRIEFKGSKHIDHYQLEISDSGIGIDDRTITKLFTIKANGSRKGTQGEKGTGIGLSLCKDFIEKNNGSIHVESKIDHGTTFYLKLPLSVNRPINVPAEDSSSSISQVV